MIIDTNLKSALLGSGAAIALLAGPAFAADESTDLKVQIDALQNRLNQLESSQTAKSERVAPAQAVTAGEFPGSWKLPGTDTSLSFSGYARVDAMYTIGRPHASTGGAGLGSNIDSFVVSSIARDGSVAAGQSSDFRMHARQSRVRFDTRTPTDWGSLRTRIEGDFFGTGGNERFSNSSTFRIRHAYGQLGPVLGGQTWSTFMDQDTFFDTVDFFGTAGQEFGRIPQIRYSTGLGDMISMDLSIENPEQTNIRNVANAASTNNNFVDKAPDFVAALRYRPSWGAINLSGIGRYFKYSNGVGDSDTAFGGGGHLGVTIKTPFTGKQDAFSAVINGGKGIGRILTGTGARDYVVNNANNGTAGQCAGSLSVAAGCGADITLNAALGWWAGFTHYWTDSLRSNAYYSTGYNDVNTAKLGRAANGQTEHTRMVHANIMWNPVSRVTIGLEFMHGDNYTAAVSSGTTGVNFGDKDGHASRVQLGMQYNF
jgi:hypothetical protein